MSTLSSSLKCDYPSVNCEALASILDTIQASIRQKVNKFILKHDRFFPRIFEIFFWAGGRVVIYLYIHYARIYRECNLCLFVFISDHNSWTLGPICLKFWLGNSGEARECLIFILSWVSWLLQGEIQAKLGSQAIYNNVLLFWL